MNLTIVNQNIRISPRRNKRTLSANIIPHKSPNNKNASNLQNFLFSQKDGESTNRVMMYRDTSSSNTISRPIQKHLRIKVLSSTRSSEKGEYARVSPLPFF